MCITKQREKYGYGYKMGTGRLKRQRILLPVDASDNPDWAFMEAYMKQKEKQILKPTIERLYKQLITNDIIEGGVKRYAPIGKNLFLVKNFLFNPPIAA